MLGNDQYPKTITDLNNVLSNHRFDAISNKAVGKKSPTDNKNKDQKDKGKEEEVLTLSFAQLEGKCPYCGKAGHNSPSCQDMVNKPKDKWAINKAQQSYALTVASDANTVASITRSSSQGSQQANKGEANVSQTGWAGAHLEFQF